MLHSWLSTKAIFSVLVTFKMVVSIKPEATGLVGAFVHLGTREGTLSGPLIWEVMDHQAMIDEVGRVWGCKGFPVIGILPTVQLWTFTWPVLGEGADYISTIPMQGQGGEEEDELGVVGGGGQAEGVHVCSKECRQLLELKMMRLCFYSRIPLFISF